MEGLTPQIREKIQELIEENRQLRKDLGNREAQIKLKDEIMTEYEQDISTLRSIQNTATIHTNALKELESQSKYLRELVDEKTTELAKVALELDSTKRQLSDAEKLIRELETPQSSHDYSMSSVEPSNSAELAKLHDDLNEALYKIASSELRERALQEQLNQLSDSHEYLAEENKDYKKTLMDIKENNMELECQLAELKSSNPHAKQGNSMFGEVADEYRKLEDDMKEVVKQLKILKRENTHLKNELEEARLLATNRERQEKIGRCVCDELKPELEQQRLRGDHLQRKIHALEAQIHNFGKGVSAQEVGKVFKVSFDSLKSQLDIANREVTDLRIERNALKDRNSSLSMMVSQAQNQEKIAHEEVNLLKTQIVLIRNNHAKEIAKLENPALYENQLSEPKISETFASAADTLARLTKSKTNAIHETPAKAPAPFPSLSTQTPAPDDVLRRLTLNNSASQSLLDLSSTTFRDRKKKKDGGKKTVVKQLVNNFVPIQMEMKDGKVVKKENIEVSNNLLNDTMGMFEGISTLPPSKFKISSTTASTKQFPLSSALSNLNQTICGNQSMDLETTHREDLFDVDLSKNPFDENGSDQSTIS